MSRIIKAGQIASVTPFDFLNMDEGASDGSAKQVGEPECSEPAVEQDPFSDLEEIIRNRLLEAQTRAEELESEGYEKGYAQGLKDGTEYGAKSMEVVREQMERVLAGLQDVPSRVLKDYRDWLLATTLAISRKLVRRELKTRPEVIAGLIENVLGQTEEDQGITIYFHPKDLDLLKNHTGLESLIDSGERPLALKPDAQIERGGCRLESDIRLIDATLETQFALIEEALFSQPQEEEEHAEGSL